MSKEYLEAFELVKRTCELYIQSASHLIGADIIGNKIDEAVDTIKNRLESIDNANPSEALECLVYIKSQSPVCYNDNGSQSYVFEKEFDTIKQVLIKAQENARSEEILQKYYQEGITLDSVRALNQERDNYKKILEIIKERHIDILNLEECIEREKMGNVASALEYYNENYAFNRSCELTQEEFDLLKRWLE